MFNNDTTTGAGAVVPTSSATVPSTIFPGTTITSNSTFIIIGPPPPFPAPPRSIDFTPIKLIFASVLADGEEIRQLSACKHEFHVSCIEEWLQTRSNCPNCRADVPVKPTEADANVNGNVNVNRSGGGNRRVSATNRDDDWRQGLPDASSLV
ncbi:BnaA04g21540D [Brassica napus]|uniref:BnaA04g21540D protein n=1 Tax=Brassica napus TaxID=3708 RepID=A0A078G1D2_BRANA|nr:BnaA04g21540D [Brassica napus]